MMEIMVALISLSGGAFVAAGLFSLITTSRVVNRMLNVLKVSGFISIVEEMIILGATFGNIIYVYSIKTELGEIIGSAFMLFSGMFCGAILVALAEVIKTIPIFVRRVRISGGFGYVIIAFALGKVFGAIIENF